MARYTLKFEGCGHEGDVHLIGPHKTREYRMEKMSKGVCPECYKKKLEEQRASDLETALEKSSEMELPKLQGSEKQITWALTIRQKFIDKYETNFDFNNETKSYIKSSREDFGRALKSKKNINELENLYRDGEDPLLQIDINNTDLLIDQCDKMFEIFLSKTDCKFWIENRNVKLEYLLLECAGEALKSDEDKAMEKEIEKEEKRIIDESTVFPENQQYKSVVDIKYDPETRKISLYYEKDEDFIKIVKSKGYKWEGAWERKVKKPAGGNPEDRLAEIGNALLSAGFAVIIREEKARGKAINGTFEKECKRWVLRKDDNTVKVTYETFDGKIHSYLKSIPGAKYEHGTLFSINLKGYQEILELESLFGFEISDVALKMLQEYKENYEEELKSVKKVKPTKVENAKMEYNNGLEDILNSSREVIDDLIDD